MNTYVYRYGEMIRYSLLLELSVFHPQIFATVTKTSFGQNSFESTSYVNNEVESASLQELFNGLQIH